MALFLEEEWNIYVNRSTVSRLLKKERINLKKAQRVGNQSQELVDSWRSWILYITAEQLVFIDESIFKRQTGWRAMAYTPIGYPARYTNDIRRGESWSILPVYTTEGYLPYTAVRQGYFNQETFFEWIQNELLPYCNPYPGPRSTICLDNSSVHVDPRVQNIVEDTGCLLKFLPLYSPKFSPIELLFSVLKAWIRRYWRGLRDSYPNFGDFLQHAIEESRCDRFDVEHFKHAGGRYLFDGDIEAFHRELEQYRE